MAASEIFSKVTSGLGTAARATGRGGAKLVELGAYGLASGARRVTDDTWHELGGSGSPLGALGRYIAQRTGNEDLISNKGNATEHRTRDAAFNPQQLEAIRIKLSSVDDKLALNNSLLTQIAELSQQGAIQSGQQQQSNPKSMLLTALSTIASLLGPAAVGAIVGYVMKEGKDETPTSKPPVPVPVEPKDEPLKKVSDAYIDLGPSPSLTPVAFKMPSTNTDKSELKMGTVQYVSKSIKFAADRLKINGHEIGGQTKLGSSSSITPFGSASGGAFKSVKATSSQMIAPTSPSFGVGMGGNFGAPGGSSSEMLSAGSGSSDSSGVSAAPSSSSSPNSAAPSTSAAPASIAAPVGMGGPFQDASGGSSENPALAAQGAPSWTSNPQIGKSEGFSPTPAPTAPSATPSATPEATPAPAAPAQSSPFPTMPGEQASAPAAPTVKTEKQLQIAPGSTLAGLQNKKGNIEIPFYVPNSMVPAGIPREKDGSIDPKKIRPEHIPEQYKDKISEYGASFKDVPVKDSAKPLKFGSEENDGPKQIDPNKMDWDKVLKDIDSTPDPKTQDKIDRQTAKGWKNSDSFGKWWEWSGMRRSDNMVDSRKDPNLDTTPDWDHIVKTTPNNDPNKLSADLGATDLVRQDVESLRKEGITPAKSVLDDLSRWEYVSKYGTTPKSQDDLKEFQTTPTNSEGVQTNNTGNQDPLPSQKETTTKDLQDNAKDSAEFAGGVSE